MRREVGRHLEITPQGLEEFMSGAWKLHITLSGVPHHVERNFGYWHINDMDELYLPVPGPTTDSIATSS